MRYAVKINSYYVSDVIITETGYISEITLSCEVMKAYKKQTAELIARLVNGTVVTMLDEEVSENDN